MTKPYLISGGKFKDNRGSISFVNDFKFEDVKRFYIIEHQDTSVIRAWQGHKAEKKYFYVVNGSFIIKAIKPDNWENPSKELVAEKFILNENESNILCLPQGFINGFKVLEENSKLMVFSNMENEESADDLIRFPLDYWKF